MAKLNVAKNNSTAEEYVERCRRVVQLHAA